MFKFKIENITAEFHEWSLIAQITYINYVSTVLRHLLSITSFERYIILPLFLSNFLFLPRIINYHLTHGKLST